MNIQRLVHSEEEAAYKFTSKHFHSLADSVNSENVDAGFLSGWLSLCSLWNKKQIWIKGNNNVAPVSGLI